MVVKQERGRRRYVVFSFEREFSKEGLISELRKKFPENTPYVIQTAGKLGIIRCAPKETEKIIENVKSAIPGSDSKTTSGTLAAVRKKYPSLKISKKPSEPIKRA